MSPMKPILLATAALVAQPVMAQNTSAVPAADTTGFGDIVVTARKTEEKLQDVPLTIKALSGQDLADRGIASVSELSQYTPGLTYSPDFGRTGERPVIRGISALRSEAPQPVSIFVNGVFVRDAALGLVLDDAERVEVIKGPQSALYGRSTYAGAINYITVKPGNEAKGKLSATISGGGERTISGAVTLPLVKDVLSVRVRGRHYEFGGQYTNSQTGNKIGSERTNAIGGELSFTPSSSFDALLSLDHSADRDGFFAATIRTIPTITAGVITATNGTTNLPNGSVCNGRTINIVANNTTVGNPLFGLPDPNIPGTLTNRLNGWPCGSSKFTGTTVRRNDTDFLNYTDPTSKINYGDIRGLDRKILRASATLNFHFGEGYTLTSQTAYTQQTSNVGADQSYSGVRFTPTFLGSASWASYDRDRLNYWSQEVRLSSPQDQAFTWLLGGFYYKEEGKGITSPVIIFSPTLGATPAPLTAKSATSSRNIAGFGAIRYAFSDSFKISAEARYGEEQVKVGGTPLRVITVSAGTCTAVGQPCVLNGDRTFRDFSPRVTVDFKPAPGILLYGQVAKGQKSGGFNSTPGLPASSFAYDGEKVWSYEIGLKSDIFDRRVRFNMAFFQNDIQGLQLSNLAVITDPFSVNPLAPSTTTTTIVNNVGKARTRGFEFELDIKPTSWLTLTSNYAYTDAKAIEGTEVTNGTVFGGNRSVAGFVLPRTPRVSAAVGAAVDFPVTDTLNIFARTDVTYQSRRYAEIQNLIWADPFTRVNASIGVRGKGWRATAFVKNLTDNSTSLNGFRYLDPNTFRRTAVDFLPRLRQFGGTVALDF
jgi:iron complex outermembrane recepter protein